MLTEIRLLTLKCNNHHSINLNQALRINEKSKEGYNMEIMIMSKSDNYPWPTVNNSNFLSAMSRDLPTIGDMKISLKLIRLRYNLCTMVIVSTISTTVMSLKNE